MVNTIDMRSSNSYRTKAWIVFGATVVALIVSWEYQFAAIKQQSGSKSGSGERCHIELDHSEYKINNNNHQQQQQQQQQHHVPSVKEKVLLQREKTVVEREKAAAEREKALLEKETTTIAIEKKVVVDKAEKDSGDSTNDSTNDDYDESSTIITETTTTTTTTWDDEEEQDAATWNKMTSIKKAQIENYRAQKAMILNVQPTHHAGAAFCKRIGHNGINGSIVPTFHCMGDKDGVFPNPPYCNDNDNDNDPLLCNSFEQMKHSKVPWTKPETGPFVQALRPYFHMISWELQSPRTVRKFGRTLDSPDWDHPNLVSVIVTRDPTSRLLAFDSQANKTYPGYRQGELNRTSWWDYAAYNQEIGTDNFLLRILTDTDMPGSSSSSGGGSSSGSSGSSGSTRNHKKKKRKKKSSNRDRNLQNQNHQTQNHVRLGIERTTDEVLALLPTGIDQSHFEHGKAILRKFTFVLDIACLDEGMDVLGRLLHMDLSPPKERKRTTEANHHSVTSRERIGYEDVYEYLVAKNEWDIALYEYSKTISLIRCEDDYDLQQQQQQSATPASVQAPPMTTTTTITTNPPTDATNASPKKKRRRKKKTNTTT
jgi:hypothetical protein